MDTPFNLLCQHGSVRFGSIVYCECYPDRVRVGACSVDPKMAWSEDETICLIQLWDEDSIQGQIEGCRWNKEVFAKLASQMQSMIESR